jgi:NADH-quinone oxidoreductase subunit G
VAKIYVDGKELEADPRRNLLEECLSRGLNLPYFCWHPALGSVGSCRQCAVKQFKDENDTRGRIVMACMTPAADGTRISIDDPEAVEFRESIIEFLMENHPHDCPVCDEGGECHLQDMTVMTGHTYRRFRFDKRTYNNQYLGPLINHEMNRCIQCYRCVRFYRDFAGGRDFDVFAAHNHVYFGRYKDGVLENEFSGNLVEICPTGVFTDRTFKQHFTRKWDLQTAPSVCVHCGLGCNTIPGERYGELRRIRNRYNEDVNGYFLCDRGRYGYEFVNSERRIRQPRLKLSSEGDAVVTPTNDVLEHATSLLGRGRKAIGIGSPRVSLEANFALRQLVGPDRFFGGWSELEAGLAARALALLRDGPARSASLHEVEEADAALVLGEDLTNTAPMMALSLRQAVRHQPMLRAAALGIPDWDDAAVRELLQQERGPLFVATPAGTKLDDVARETFRAAPQDIARLGFAVAHAVDGKSPEVSGLGRETAALAKRIAEALKTAERPVIISGMSCADPTVMEAAAHVAWALCAKGVAAGLSLTVPEPNSLGLAMMGAPGLDAAGDMLRQGAADTLIVLENDLSRRVGAPTLDSLLEGARHVIVVDHLESPMTASAEVVLPAATFAEGDGTLVNNEGRAQRFFQVFVPEADVIESWRWIKRLMVAAGRDAPSWSDLDDVTQAMAEAIPALASAVEAAPASTYRLVGQKIPRQPHRYSGRTAMLAAITVHEPKPPDDPDTALAFSMEGATVEPPPALLSGYWSPGWNSVQSLNKFQAEVGGPLRGGGVGVRLIEPAPASSPNYATNVPQPFKARSDEMLVVPRHHIFGSEELSVHAPGLAELAPGAYVSLNPDDADKLGLAEGAVADLTLEGEKRRLPVKLDASLARGVAALPIGLEGLPGSSMTGWGEIGPAEAVKE